MPDALLTTGEAAARLQVSARTLRREIAEGRLRVVRIGRLVRVRPADLDDLILSGLTRGPSPCRSKNVVELGAFASKSAEKRLDALVGAGRPNRMRANSKRGF